MRVNVVIVSLLCGTFAAAQDFPAEVCRRLPRQAVKLPAQVSQSTCANGDFESGLDAAEWFGQHGAVKRDGEPVFVENGLIGNESVSSCDAHQTLVRRGADPIAPISTVAPGGLTQAVRLGNAAWNARTESLGKTFVVEATHSVIAFSYAVVFQDPDDHDDHELPSFEVRVLDAGGDAIGGVVDLGGGTSKLIGDKTRFPSIGNDLTVYQDWTRGIIDLSKHVDQTVTVLFITEDCALGAHFAYAYIDNFCGGECGPKLGPATECGPGRICFRYTPACAANSTPAATLDLLQDGLLKASLSEPAIANDLICFAIDPANIPALDPALVGFDFILRTNFGVAAGDTPGFNNDYFISCPPGACCPGALNLIANGAFEGGNTGFESDYDYRAAPYTAGIVRPGQYAVLDAAEAAGVAPTWQRTCPTGKFLVVNGETSGTGNRKVWSQTVKVVPGTTYRFCVKAGKLPQPAFDRDPTIELRFTDSIGSVTEVVDLVDACGWELVDAEITIPAGVTSITCEIWLKDDQDGDGNDLAIDDVSLQKLCRGNPSLAQLDIVTSDVENGTYTVTATPIHGQPFPFTWELCELDANGACIDGTRSLGTAAPTGPFDAMKTYRMTYMVDDPCTAIVTSTRQFGPRR